MRLTLRTMLAYLDDLLEPADRNAIGQKIEEADFARRLVQRVRDCMRNPRLPAPKLHSKDSVLDPNTVAEYLDNTLVGERVADYEKTCLPTAETGPELVESDIYLAETAACHQILAMVLAQPAQIDQEMKRRMYNIAVQKEQSPLQAKFQTPAHDGLAAGSLADFEIKSARKKPEVPEYLRQPAAKMKWKPIAAAIALLLILAVTITMALGPLDTNPIARFFGFGHAPDNAVADKGPDKAPAENGNTAADGGAQTNPAAAGAGTVATAQGTPTDNTATAPIGTPSATEPAMPAVAVNGNNNPQNPPAPGTGAAAPSQPNPFAAAPVDAAAGGPYTNTAATPGANPAGMAAGTAPAAGPGTPPDQPVGIEPTGPAGPPPTPQPGDTAMTNPSPSPASTASRPAMPDAAVPTPGNTTIGTVPAGNPLPNNPGVAPVVGIDDKPLGKYVPGKDTLLLKFDPTSGQFARVAPSATVSSGERLMVLPLYRPTLALSAGFTLQIPAETLLELLPPEADGTPGVKLLFGRLVAMTAGKADAKLALDLGTARGVATFVDGDATLGIEVRRMQPIGVNPESQEPRIFADLYVAGGQIQWTAADGTATVLKGPQHWIVPVNPGEAVQQPPASAAAVPKWMSPEPLNSTDTAAAAALVGTLENDNKPLALALNEMVAHHRIEFKSMAARCMVYLDEFKPIVDAFRDDAQKPMWVAEIASIRSAIARSPAAAAKVREAFETQRGDQSGKELYRMLWGYNKDQLQSGEAAKLVDYLDNDSLDFRLLAFTNLSDITNKTFLYRPEATAAVRSQSVRRWRDELKAGNIVPKEPAPPREAAAK
ncbi:MAG TPA: hypothetical protein VGJ15_00245 [Pirellulales bacterium]